MFLLPATAAAIVVVGALGFAGPAATTPAKPEWLTDLAAAQQLARQHNRPILATLH